MRVVRFLLGLYLVACSTVTSVFYFLPHSTARMNQIFKDGHYEYLLWGSPPAVCIFACFVFGAWLIASAFAQPGRKPRVEPNI